MYAYRGELAGGAPGVCRIIVAPPLQIISDTVQSYDTIRKRSLLFVKRCLQNDFAVVKHVPRCGVYHGRTKSILGANIQSCIERFGVTLDALLENIL